MNTRGIAYINHGRWLVDCPDCGSAILFSPKDGNRIVCGHCNPEVFAIMFVKRGGREIYDAVPDHERRARTRANAKAFTCILPDNWGELFETLRVRHVSNMNWLPGETLNDLRAENIQHDLLSKSALEKR